MRSLLTWSMPLLVLLAAACGGSVDAPPGGGGGAGGEAGAPTTTSGGGGGGAPVACGGFSGGTCDATQVCVWPDGSCGATDGQGVCESRPEGCPEDCPGVCGCDGQFYCNACIARSAGIDVSANGSCAAAGGDYSAYFWPGGLDHIIVLKADPVADRCVMLYLDWPTQSAPGFEITAPDGWGSSHAVVTDRAADCATPSMQPVGQVAQATGGAGAIAWEVAAGMYAPCALDVSVTLAFAGAPAWAPAMSQLEAMGVMVEGGCM